MQSHTELGGDGMATTWKTLVSSLLVVILLLGGSLVFAPKAEAMRDILFPFITTEAGKFTFVQIINDGSPFFVAPAAAYIPSYHLTYATKVVPAGGLSAVSKTDGCEHFDGDVTTTLQDQMIFEAGGKVQTDPPSFVLFEGAAPVTSTALPLLVPARVGFLIVSQPATNDAFIFGWASVIDAASGLAWTYSTDWLTSGFAGDPAGGDFSRIDGSAAFADRKFTAWYPTSIVSPLWYLVPLSAGTTMAPSGGGGIRRAIRTSVDHGSLAGTAGAFDLDEQFFSGGKDLGIRCFGFFVQADLLQPGVVAATLGGGHFSTIPTTITGPPDFTPGAYLLYRIMTTTALGGAKTTVNHEPAHTPFFTSTP